MGDAHKGYTSEMGINGITLLLLSSSKAKPTKDLRLVCPYLLGVIYFGRSNPLWGL
jgi:hypothetical protein